jgi:hypothetical protein
MNAEYILLRKLITVDLWNSNIEQNLKLLNSRKHSLLASFGTEYLTDTDSGNILQPYTCLHTQTHPQSCCAAHTNTPTELLCSMNIIYFGVSEFLGFHLRKVCFSSTNT